MANYRRVLDIVKEAQEAALLAIGIMIAGQATELAPVDTGRLKGSITFATAKQTARVSSPADPSEAVTHSGDVNTVVIGTNVKYAPHIEYGTAPHKIMPKGKKALYWAGAEHPVKMVEHPGAAAQPFMRPALDMCKPNITGAVKEVMRQHLSDYLK